MADQYPISSSFVADVKVFENLTWIFPKVAIPLNTPLSHDAKPFAKESKRYNFSDPEVKKITTSILIDKSDYLETIHRIRTYVNSRVVYEAAPHPNTGSQILDWGKGR